MGFADLKFDDTFVFMDLRTSYNYNMLIQIKLDKDN